MNTKITCSVINDLLPLYTDNVLSSDSRILVEEHMESCQFCRTAALQMKSPLTLGTDTDKAHIAKMKRSVENKNFIRISLLCFGIIFILMLTGSYAAYRADNFWSDGMSKIRSFWYIVIPTEISAGINIGYIFYILSRERRDSGNIRKKAVNSYSVLLAVCVLVFAGFKMLYLGNPALSDDIETTTEFQYSAESYLEQEWVINFTDKKGKPLNVISEVIYKDMEQGDMRKEGVILHVNEVPIKGMMKSSGYSYGYSCNEFAGSEPIPEHINYKIIVKYNDKTVTYDMRHEGLFEKQSDIKYFPCTPDTPEEAQSDTTVRSVNGVTDIYDN